MIVQDDIINDDGTVYLLSARLINQGDLSVAYQVHNLPLYSAMIAGISLFGVQLETAANILNILFQAITAIVFVLIVHQSGGRGRTLIIASALILTYPTFIKYHSMIIRDQGYLAFYLLSLFYFIRYVKTRQYRHCAGWSFSTLIAGMFRLEGIVFLMLLPFYFLFQEKSYRNKLITFIKCNSIILISAFAIIITLIATLGFDDFVTANIKRIQGYFSSSYGGAFDSFSAKKDAITHHVLPQYSDEYSGLMLTAGLAGILIAEIAKSIGLWLLPVLAYGYVARIKPENQDARSVINTYMLVNVLVLTVFVFNKMFLTGRYPVALAVTILVYIPFILEYWYKRYLSEATGAGNFRKLVATWSIIYAVLVLDSFIAIGSSKHYIKDSAYWLRDHTQHDTKILTFSNTMNYYAGRLTPQTLNNYPDKRKLLALMKQGKLTGYEYIAVQVDADEQDIETALRQYQGFEVVTEFANEKNDKVLILQAI
jgi:hypothetical protein